MTQQKVEHSANTSSNQLPHDKADVVIVGGGPIGFAQAWGIKKLNRDLNVVVLEKYQEFQRKHTLVMQPAQLEALMKATDSMDDPRLKALLQQLRKNPNIRTNVLQETFKSIAESLNVQVKIEEVKADKIEEQLFAYEPKLIIGADGTHSVVSEQLFAKDNQIKHEVDFAMQVRFEVDGDYEKDLDQSVQFYQRLAHHGLIATEQIGKPDPVSGKTPVTMQIVIPKEDYDELYGLERKPKANDPIKPFANGLDKRELPEHLQKFVDSYLLERIQFSGNRIKAESIRISVNELPATRARQVFTQYQNKEKNLDTHVALSGDSALGLSYFKGLNAGLEASAKFFSELKGALKQGLTDKNQLNESLNRYANWFSPYADNKVKEVKQYSTLKVRSGMKVIKSVHGTKLISAYKPEVDKKPLINAYYRLLARASDKDNIEFKPYPHRAYNPDIQLGQFGPVSVRYTLTKIGKLFADFFKPYKGNYQVVDDFKQPLTGAINILMGSVKLLTGIVKPKRFIDGAFTVARGIVEIATTPLTWFVKPFTRGLATLFSRSVKVEDNSGVKNLVHLGNKLLDAQGNDEISFKRMRDLLGVCNDLHRKFDKSVQRGQGTNVDAKVEKELITDITAHSDEPLSVDKLRNYFSLFQGKKPVEAVEEQKELRSEASATAFVSL